MAIVHHRASHRNLAGRPVMQPWQTGSPGGGGVTALLRCWDKAQGEDITVPPVREPSALGSLKGTASHPRHSSGLRG